MINFNKLPDEPRLNVGQTERQQTKDCRSPSRLAGRQRSRVYLTSRSPWKGVSATSAGCDLKRASFKPAQLAVVEEHYG